MGLLILLLHPSRRRLENANYPFSFWGCFWRRPCGVRVIRNGNLMTTVLVRSWQGDVYIPRGGPMTWWKLIWAVNRFHVYFIFARIICINFFLSTAECEKKAQKQSSWLVPDVRPEPVCEKWHWCAIKVELTIKHLEKLTMKRFRYEKSWLMEAQILGRACVRVCLLGDSIIMSMSFCRRF